MADKGGYMFMKWNGAYGEAAKFVVKDLSTGQESMFTPGRADDVVWTKADLSNAPEMKDWQDFGNETVDDLDAVAF